MDSRDIAGDWGWPSDTDPGRQELACVTETGYWIQFVIAEKGDPDDRRVAIPSTYEFETDGTLVVYFCGKKDSYTNNQVTFEGGVLVITQVERRWEFTRVPEEQIPDWYEGRVRKAIERLEQNRED